MDQKIPNYLSLIHPLFVKTIVTWTLDRTFIVLKEMFLLYCNIKSKHSPEALIAEILVNNIPLAPNGKFSFL